jgi:hypothetical protein
MAGDVRMAKQPADFFRSEYLEFTTQIGCSVNCRKYCPQEIFLDKYRRGERTLSIVNFRKLLKNVPKDVTIVFGGFSEPFQNNECTDMIIDTYTKGYKVGLFTTLQGLSLPDAIRLRDIAFEMIYLHLPDSFRNANIPLTANYQNVLTVTLSSHPYTLFTSMNGFFQTNNRENMARGNTKSWKWYPVHCKNYDHPQFTVLPNGDVHFCCMDMKLEHRIGNLFRQPYLEIRNFVEYPVELCRYCDQSNFILFDTIYKLKMALYPGKLIGV